MTLTDTLIALVVLSLTAIAVSGMQRAAIRAHHDTRIATAAYDTNMSDYEATVAGIAPAGGA